MTFNGHKNNSFKPITTRLDTRLSIKTLSFCQAVTRSYSIPYDFDWLFMISRNRVLVIVVGKRSLFSFIFNSYFWRFTFPFWNIALPTEKTWKRGTLNVSHGELLCDQFPFSLSLSV